MTELGSTLCYTHDMSNAVTSFPKIVTFLGKSDSGEFGNAICPHCGAKGRYVIDFVCEDGVRRGAMSGCIKLFPISPLAKEHIAITERQTERAAKGQKLASWDIAKLDAIDQVLAGALTVEQALVVVRDQNYKRSVWIDRNKSGKGRR